MKKLRRKRGLILLVVSTLLLSNIDIIFAESFEGRETEMNAKCSVITDTETQEECARYKAYLQEKSDNLDKEIRDIQNQIASVKGDVEKVTNLIQNNNDKIKTYETEIASIEDSIDQIQISIDKLNVQIKEKEENIKERDEQMKERLVEMQAYTGSNYYIDFLMGSTSFSDLLRRTEIIAELNKYENEQIKLLNEEKESLNEDREIVEDQKELLIIQQDNIENSKAKLEALNESNKELLSSYHKEEATLTAQKREAQMAQASLPKIDLSLAANFDEETSQGGNESSNGNTDQGQTDNDSNESDNNSGNSGDSGNPGGSGSSGGTGQSSGFISPLQSGWHYEAGTWHYPGGGGHMGMDFSTGNRINIPVVAPANGIIIHTYSGCKNGYSDCGVPIGGGNNVLLLTRVNGVVYAMPFCHLTSVAVSVNQKVEQGQVMGYSGNSGWSLGNHCHVEIIRVGNLTMSEALSIYNTTGDMTFGTGWDANNPNACGSAPCRERPENYWL